MRGLRDLREGLSPDGHPGGVGRDRVDGALCVGCGRCAKVCPADVIAMVERGAGA